MKNNFLKCQCMTPLQESKKNINLETQRGHKNLKKVDPQLSTKIRSVPSRSKWEI